MKMLLTVTGLVLCAWLTLAFAPLSTNESATAKNYRTSIRKWQHTTWVNPWVKKVRIAENVFANTFNNSLNPGSLCQLTYSGMTVNILMEGYKWLIVPVGYPCTYEAAMYLHPFYDTYVAEVVDMTTSTTLYSFFGSGPVYFQWTPVADHWYEVYTAF